jgi:hypothetical protein
MAGFLIRFILRARKGRKQFFFEKKNQKTFAPWVCGSAGATAHRDKSFFCFFFLQKKEVLASFLVAVEFPSQVDFT